MKFESEFDKMFKHVIAEDAMIVEEADEKDPNENDDTPEDEAEVSNQWSKKLVDQYIEEVVKRSRNNKEFLAKTRAFVEENKLKGVKMPSALWVGRVAPAAKTADIKGKKYVFNPAQDYALNTESNTGKAILGAFGFESNKDFMGESEEGTTSGLGEDETKKVDPADVKKFLTTAKIVRKAIDELKEGGDQFKSEIEGLKEAFNKRFEQAFGGKVLTETLYKALLDMDDDEGTLGWGEDEGKFKAYLKAHGGAKLSMKAKDDEGLGDKVARKWNALFSESK